MSRSAMVTVAAVLIVLLVVPPNQAHDQQPRQDGGTSSIQANSTASTIVAIEASNTNILSATDKTVVDREWWHYN